MKSFFAAVPRVTMKVNPVAAYAVTIAIVVASFALLQHDAAIVQSAAGASCADVRYLATELSTDFANRAAFALIGHPPSIKVIQIRQWQSNARELIAHKYTTCPLPVVEVQRTKLKASQKPRGTP